MRPSIARRPSIFFRLSVGKWRRFERIGYPEAIWLHESHARHALTTETPSEFALHQRVLTHMAVIEECVRRVYRQSGSRNSIAVMMDLG
jgi:hypothetical protein